MIEISEKQFESQVEQLARLYGWRVYHTWSSMHSVRGYPDLTMVRLSRLIFAELKAERGKVTEAQQEWLDALQATGKCQVFVWRPSQWEQIQQELAGTSGD